MSMINRVRGFSDNLDRVANRIPPHRFSSMFTDYAVGGMSEATFKNRMLFNAGQDLADWLWFKGLYEASADQPGFREVTRAIFELVSKTTEYPTEALIRARIQSIA